MSDRRRVAVVTGGGGGIGGAIAEELGRRGVHVVTVDPLVTVDGAEVLPEPSETTAGRIVAAGGSAQASSVSVTDADAVRALFASLAEERGGLDAVVNVAGISRPTSFARGTEEDWRSVLAVHLDGYLNVLRAALPIMTEAGHGRILGVTSGSGWRPADTGAYGCAKRAVAALTWQLGRHAPPGVVVNAMSPIAATRMVTAALGRARTAAAPAAGSSSTDAGGGTRAGAGSSATGGLSLGSMPAPEELGPVGAYLVGEELSWCSGEIVFVGGPEVALIEPPRLLEVVRTEPAAALAHVLDVAVTDAFVPAEAQQATSGATNPRFPAVFDEPADAGDTANDTAGTASGVVRSCAIVSDRPELAAAITAALEARGVSCRLLVDDGPGAGPGSGSDGAFERAARSLADAGQALGVGSALDAVVVARSGGRPATGAGGWSRVLDEHAGIVARVHGDAAWARAVADLATGSDHPIRLVTLTDATTSGGASRAQAAAQLSRAARTATHELVAAFAIAVETNDPAADPTLAEITAHLLTSAHTPALSGAELAVGAGWYGLRSHPRPTGSITIGRAGVPAWFAEVFGEVVDRARGGSPSAALEGA
jgi:NAD(P)-dependent dehydrogenase (short-subunit alcohol dehydrogenase family)